MDKLLTKEKNTRSNLFELIRFYGAAALVFMLLCYGAYFFVEPAPPKQLTIATASKDGNYYSFAKEYRELLAKQGIDLQILETTGSVENLQLLDDDKAQIAFIQGGIAEQTDFPEFQGLASLYLEPLFIFTRHDLHISTLMDLSGLKIGIGPEGSGTRKIALQIAEDINLLNSTTTNFFPSTGQKGADQLLSGEIDVLFMVTGIESEIVQNLLTDTRVRLINLKRAEAYSRLHPYLSHIIIPEGLLNMQKNYPEKDIHLVAPAATLVANETLHPVLTDLLMQITEKVHKGGSLLKPEKSFPSPENIDFPLSKEAERYFKYGPPLLQRFLPFWAASLIDRLKFMILPLIALLVPLMKVLPPAYRWRIRSRIYRWYDELLQLDAITRKETDTAVFEQAIISLDKMEDEVRVVEVPLSYAEELYHLRLHIDLLRKQLTRLIQK